MAGNGATRTLNVVASIAGSALVMAIAVGLQPRAGRMPWYDSNFILISATTPRFAMSLALAALLLGVAFRQPLWTALGMMFPYVAVGAVEVTGLRAPNQADAALAMLTAFPFFTGLAVFLGAQVGRRWRDAGAAPAESPSVANPLPGRGVQSGWMIASVVTGTGIAWIFQWYLALNAVAVSAWLGLTWLALSHGWLGGPAGVEPETPASADPGGAPPVMAEAKAGIGPAVGGGIAVAFVAWLVALVALAATDGFGLYDVLGLGPLVFSPALIAAGLTWIFFWQGMRRKKFASRTMRVGGVAGTVAAFACSGLLVFPVVALHRSSQDKAVMGNARQLSAAADQYYVEYGGSRVAYAELVGATYYVKALNSVAGESYPQHFTQGMTITVTGIAGMRTITYAP